MMIIIIKITIITIYIILTTRGMERSAVSSFLTTMSHIFLYVPTMLVVNMMITTMTMTITVIMMTIKMMMVLRSPVS